MPYSALPRILGGVVTALRPVVRFVRRVPIIDNAINDAARRWFNPVVVKLIRNPTDPDLHAALELYEKRIPEDQRFESSDIIRWIRDDIVNRRRHASTRPTDWFLVAKFRRRVCGFVLFHYYPTSRIAFFAYMVVVNTPGAPFNGVSGALADSVANLLARRRELFGCTALVFEVDDPRKATSFEKQEECLARIRRFSKLAEAQGFSVRAFEMDYKQPKLSIQDHTSVERPLLLMFAHTPVDTTAAEITLNDAKRVLSFIYTELYPESFSTDPAENEAYRLYCAQLGVQAIDALPNPVRSLGCGELLAQLHNIRLEKSQRRKPKVAIASSKSVPATGLT